MATKTTAQTATATTRAPSPIASTSGSRSTRPRLIEATANMPSGKTIDHRVGTYRNGTLCTKCRQTPAPTNIGISQTQKLQNTTTVPAIRLRVASTIGVDCMATMLVPATTAIAIAPIATQYGGSNSRGVMPKWMIRSSTSIATPA